MTMRNILLLSILFSAAFLSFADGDKQNKSVNASEILSEVDTAWDYWKIRGYNFGVKKESVPVPVNFNTQIMTNGTVMVRGENSLAKRWGFHCFEAYANDDMSRITMLVNKHVEESMAVAELYYYGTRYTHDHDAYNWLKIGSDVRGHSFMFSRDKALFYGSLEIQNTLTLAPISSSDLLPKKPKGDDEANYIKSAKHVKYKALKNAKDGTMYFDKDKQAVVVKANGKWWKLAMTPLDDYDIAAISDNGEKTAVPQIKNPARLLVSIDQTPRSQAGAYGMYQSNLADLTDAQDDCARSRVYKNVFDNTRFIMYSEFDDDKAVEKYRTSPKMKGAIRECQQRYPDKKSDEKLYEIVSAPSDDTMLVIAVEFDISEDKIGEFLAISKPLRDGTNTEKDTLHYELYRDIWNPSKFFLYELYKNRAAHKFHSQQPHFIEWNNKCKEKGIKRTAKFWDVKEIKNK